MSSSPLADVRLSVLDLAPVVSGSTVRDALTASVDLARFTEGLGYHRYWVAEHHSMPSNASAAPAVLVGQIAASTSTIRVGSGGVMLTNHPPLVIAEQFGTLEAFHPGRIDLGVGRASGTSKRVAALFRDPGRQATDSFTDQLGELLGYFAAPVGDRPIRAIPADGNTPAVWVLGSSEFSARLAGSLGLPYSFAHHLQPATTVAAVRAYRDAFRPSETLDAPYLMLSIAVIAAESDEEAEWLAGPGRLRYLSRLKGRRILLPTAQEAMSYPYTDADLTVTKQKFASMVAGSRASVQLSLRELRDATRADELMITTLVHDHSDRRRSYELLSEGSRATPAPAEREWSHWPGECSGQT